MLAISQSEGCFEKYVAHLEYSINYFYSWICYWGSFKLSCAVKYASGLSFTKSYLTCRDLLKPPKLNLIAIIKGCYSKRSIYIFLSVTWVSEDQLWTTDKGSLNYPKFNHHELFISIRWWTGAS